MLSSSRREKALVKRMGSGATHDRIASPASLLTGCMTLGKSLKLLVLVSLQNGVLVLILKVFFIIKKKKKYQ